MNNKFNGGQETKKSNAVPISTNYRNEEFKDWPDSLLAIGTFGNRSSNLKESTQPEHNISHLKNIEDDDEQSSSSPDLAEFTPEEVGKLQKELTKLLSQKTQAVVKSELVEIQNDDTILPLDRFLNCPSSLEVDRRINSNRFSSANCSDNFDYNEEEMDRTIRVIIGRCKDVCSKQKQKKSIGKKSISFLVKKMFVCTSGGFGPAHSLRDTFTESRMEKLLKTILSKKIHPQNAPRTSTKRYLEDKHPQKVEKEEKKREKTCDDGSKWVKTDSDYSVRLSASRSILGNVDNRLTKFTEFHPKPSFESLFVGLRVDSDRRHCMPPSFFVSPVDTPTKDKEAKVSEKYFEGGEILPFFVAKISLDTLMAISCPSFHISNLENKEIIVPNPFYSQWIQQDQVILSLLISSLSKEVSLIVIGLSIAKEVWEALKAALSSTLNTQILNLHVQLQNMKQDDLSITQCLYKAKLISDMLAVVARPLTLSNQNIYIFRISK
ncbi:putative polygalacturonase-like [Capsicum annuum]|nr:putative polygalacturonase-like [Capsicum annuum]